MKAFLTFGLAVLAPQSTLGLWPIPRSLETGTTLLKLASNFDVKVHIQNPPQDLLDAVSRTKGYIQTDKLGRLVVGRGANDSTALQHAKSLPGLSLSLPSGATVRPIAEEAVRAIDSRVEGYTLVVPSDGSSAVLTANSTLGLFRGLTTFEQLWYDLGGVTYTYEAPLKIENDAPAYVCIIHPMSPLESLTVDPPSLIEGSCWTQHVTCMFLTYLSPR